MKKTTEMVIKTLMKMKNEKATDQFGLMDAKCWNDLSTGKDIIVAIKTLQTAL